MLRWMARTWVKAAIWYRASRGTTLNIGANAVLENNQSSAVYAYGATVNMTDGTIRNNKVEGDGGGMYLFNSTAVLSGGVIEGKSSSYQPARPGRQRGRRAGIWQHEADHFRYENPQQYRS